MKAIFGTTLATALLATTVAASAADLYSEPRSGGYSSGHPAYSWVGPYIGANLGYQWGTVEGSPTEPSGVIGGLQAGYNWQSQQFVFGLETDLQLSGADDVFAPWKFSNPWFGTLRARAGFALNQILFYGTAGLAYGELTAQSTRSGVSESKTNLGWALGGGMEVGFAGNWTAKAEYLYVDLSDRAYSLTGVNNGLTSSILRLGINYRF